MAIKQIRKYGDPVLRQAAKPITEITPRVHKLLDDLRDTLYDCGNGIGLAAPQIGILKRAVVIDLGEETGLIELINPEVVAAEGQQYEMDGCLSFPGLYLKTHRPFRVIVKALNRLGEEFEIEGTGLLAHCLVHEIDHLNGILFIDHVKDMTSEQLDQLMRQYQNQ